MFFNIWQLIVHIPLLNLKIPGFVSAFWREELMIWTMRNDNVEAWMTDLSMTPIEERKSFTYLLEAAGYNSTQIFINLGLILWIPIILIGLMPFALFVDNCCSVRDGQLERFGGRKRLTEKPLVQMLVNLLMRFALVSVLDISICVFISLSSQEAGAFDSHHGHEVINLALSWLFIALFICFIAFIIGYGAWRYYKAKNAKVWKDFDVSGYVCTLYEGVNIHHPENTTFYLLAFIARQIIYAATIIFMYEQPVF